MSWPLLTPSPLTSNSPARSVLKVRTAGTPSLSARSLLLRQRHVVRLESRPANVEGRGELMIRQLVVNALRCDRTGSWWARCAAPRRSIRDRRPP